MPFKTSSLLIIVAMISGLSLAGCYNWQSPVKLPQSLRPHQPEVIESDKAVIPNNTGIDAGAAQNKEAASLNQVEPLNQTQPPRFTEAPGIIQPSAIAGINTFEDAMPEVKGGPFKLDVDNMPLPAFINEVYGNMLHISFQIDKSLQNVSDLVTLRITEPQGARELSRTVAKVLAEYGVAIKKEAQHYRFLQSPKTPTEEPPLLISGRTLPEVPVTHRPIFQVVPLYHARTNNIVLSLNQMYTGQELKINEDPERSTITLQGSRQLVANALETIKFLDQPSMRGRYSLRIDPLYQAPEALTEALVQVLQSEGYGASSTLPMGSILVLPMSKINAVLVFTADQKVLGLVKQWVEVLDKPTYGSDKNTLFYYPVKNTAAGALVKTLSSLVPGIVTQQASQTQKGPGAASQAANQAATNKASIAPQTSGTSTGAKASLVVDEQRNAILFFGNSDTWSQMLPIIRQMDTQSKQVMIEVTIAEVTLGNTDTFGIQWLAHGSSGDFGFNVGTLLGTGALAPAAGALNYILDSGGKTRMVLKALATDSRVNVLSTPRLMVKSGEEAAIEIGDEVPIVTSQGVPSGSPQTGGDSIFTQNVQYRKTGVILNVKPIVHSGRRIDLDVSQELSKATENLTSAISSPAIQNRKVETTLTLKDGASVLIAGIIRDDNSYDSNGIPYLRDIPWLGYLFSTKGRSHDKSEIVIMITPYIMEDDEDVESISDAFRKQYSFDDAANTLPNKP